MKRNRRRIFNAYWKVWMNEKPIELIRPDWPAPRRVGALATTRKGGFSTAPYDGLNLALHVGDDPATVEANRELLCREAKLPAEPCWLKQTHSTIVTRIDRDNNFSLQSDAAVTNNKGQVLAIMTADCLPLLICNDDGSEVAAVHAGWRGLLEGIVENTLQEMNSQTSGLMAWIGPAISQGNFEIGEEVYQGFTDGGKIASEYFIANRPGHWLCDLPGLAHDRLIQAGVEQVYLSGLCSYEDSRRFFSYRRNNVTGRMACLIWINNAA